MAGGWRRFRGPRHGDPHAGAENGPVDAPMVHPATGRRATPESATYEVTRWERSERRTRMLTLAPGLFALALMLVSALLLFNASGQLVTFGFARSAQAMAQQASSTHTPTPTPTQMSTPTPHGTAGSATPTHSATGTATVTPGATQGTTTTVTPIVALTPTGTPIVFPTYVPTSTPAPITGPTPTPTSTPVPTVGPTPTPTSAPMDGASITSNSGNTTVDPGATFSIWFTVKNTGTTTWSSGAGYVLGCAANCFGAKAATISGSVGPGQSYTFNITMNAPSSSIQNENHYSQTTQWQMQRNGGTFGSQGSLTVTIRGWLVAYGPLTPCPGSNGWVLIAKNAGCGTLSPYDTTYPEMDLQSTPASSTQFRMEAYVHMTVAGSSNYAGTLIVDTPQGATTFGGLDFGVRPDGQWNVWKVTGRGVLSSMKSGTVGASQDYNLEVVVGGGTLYCYINGTQVTAVSTNNNVNPGPDQGVLEYMSSVNTSDVVDWSNFEIDGWG